MQNAEDAQTRNVLRGEIEALENNYKVLRSYVDGTEYDNLEIMGILQVFRETMNQLSGHILTFYVLKGQKTKITWESFLANIDNALENMRNAAHPDPRSAIQLAFNMSEPNAQEVMIYFAKLKAAL
jgi:hypothetical protein